REGRDLDAPGVAVMLHGAVAHDVDQLSQRGRRFGGRQESVAEATRSTCTGPPKEPTTTGIEVCTGLGFEDTRRNDTNSPPKMAASPAHNARNAATYSSARAPRRSQGTPNASNSSFSQPTPMPKSS